MIFTASEPIQFPFQWVPGFFPGAKAGEAWRWWSSPFTVLMLRMNGAVPPLVYFFVTCRGKTLPFSTSRLALVLPTLFQCDKAAGTWRSLNLRESLPPDLGVVLRHCAVCLSLVLNVVLTF
jgi:hypothetical protein